MSKKLDKAIAPLANALCELGDSPEMEADFKRWERNAIIEECARVADDLGKIMGIAGKSGAKEIAAAIRALKEDNRG